MDANNAGVVNLDEAFAAVDEHWTPKVAGRINDLHLKVVKVAGTFTWHRHADTDEFFLVRSGRLTIRLRDQPDAVLDPGEFFVVPAGVEHCPVADVETEVLLLEPVGVVNTGDAPTGDLTAPTDDWV